MLNQTLTDRDTRVIKRVGLNLIEKSISVEDWLWNPNADIMALKEELLRLWLGQLLLAENRGE